MKVNTEFKEVKGIGKIYYGWNVCKLGNILKEKPKYGASESAIDYDSSLPRYLRITDISSDGKLVNEEPKSIDFEVAKEYILENNDIVIARTGNTVGKSYIYNTKDGTLAYAGYLIKFKIDTEKCNPNYVFYYLQSDIFKGWVHRTLRIGAQPNINAEEYTLLDIPTPQIKEQEKIAQILSNVDMNIEKTEQAIAKYKQVKKGIMDDLLTGNVRIKDGKRFRETNFKYVKGVGKIPWDWETKKVEDIASVNYGINSPIDRTLNRGIRMIGLPNISKECSLNLAEVSLVDSNLVKEDDKLKKGDILFNWRNGSREHLGKSIYFDLDGIYTHVGFLLKIRVYDEQQYNPKFMWYYLTYIKENGFFMNSKIQVNNTFNSEELNMLNIYILDINEQRQIADILYQQDELIKKEEKYLGKLKKLKSGLMEDLLTGKVRVNID